VRELQIAGGALIQIVRKSDRLVRVRKIGSTPGIASVSVSRWLGSRVVSMHAGLRRWRARVQTAATTLSGNSLRQTVHTHCASVHQAAKLVAVLLRVVGVTVGLAKSTAGFMTYVTCRLTAKNRDQLRNPTLGNQVWATCTFLVSVCLSVCPVWARWSLVAGTD